jgi:hypothetical protein
MLCGSLLRSFVTLLGNNKLLDRLKLLVRLLQYMDY